MSPQKQKSIPVIPSKPEDEPPPFLGTWNRVYASVIVYVFILILLLYWMTVTLND